MKDSFESNPIDPDNKLYKEGGYAYTIGRPRKAPYDDQKSPEAIVWFRGYDDAHIGGGEKRLKEIAKLEEWYKK